MGCGAVKAPTVCTSPRCPHLARPGRSKCAGCENTIDQARGNAAQRGYGVRWQRIRARYLRCHPICERLGCSSPSVDIDHTPTRRELVAAGVPDPDADCYLMALCHPCHSRKTARETGLGRRRG